MKIAQRIVKEIQTRDVLKARLSIAPTVTDRDMLGETRKNISSMFKQATFQQAREVWSKKNER